MGVSIKTAKKIGVFTALMMMTGSIVGVGIFFKNNSVLRANDWNGWGVLASWVIGGLICLVAALSYAEIGSLKTNKVSGFAGWSEKVGGKKYGYFVRFNYAFFYYGLLTPCLAYFASEIFFNTLVTYGFISAIKDVPLYAHILGGIIISTFFISLNYFSIKASGVFQQISTILKWIPLIVVAFAGIILFDTNNVPPADGVVYESGVALYGKNALFNGSSFTFIGMLGALPAVLFAFDSFLTAGQLSHKIKGGVKKVPFVIIVGMLSCLVLYLMVALSAVLHGSGHVSASPFGPEGVAAGKGIFDQIFDGQTRNVISKLVVVFLLISTLGVTNGISTSGVQTLSQAVKTDTVFGSKTLRKKIGSTWTELAFITSTFIFWHLMFGIPSFIAGTDAITDGFSNFPTLFIFPFYATTILLYINKRNKLETKKINKYVFNIAAWTSVIGIYILMTYQLGFDFFIYSLINPTKLSSWGLFVGSGIITYSHMTLIMFLLAIPFFGLPYLNAYLTKKYENNNVYIDSFAGKDVIEADVSKQTLKAKQTLKINKKK